MWDEKKFFEDYVEESEKIKPDDRFVERMKRLAAGEARKKKRIPAMRYAAIAASFVVCIGLGGIIWYAQNLSTKDMAFDQTNESQADADGTMWSEEAGNAESDSTTWWDGAENPSENSLTGIIDSLEQGAIVRAEDGNEISQNGREELLALLSGAAESEEPEGIAKEASYFLEGEETIEIQVWEEGFVQIDGKWYR